MPNELVKALPASVPAPAATPGLPSLVEQAGPAGRFAWDEFFYAEHHNPHTQKAYMAAVKRFLAWAEGQVSMDPNRYEVSEPELLRGLTLSWSGSFLQDSP